MFTTVCLLLLRVEKKCLPHHWSQRLTPSLLDSSPIKTQTTKDAHKFSHTTQTNTPCGMWETVLFVFWGEVFSNLPAHLPGIYCVFSLAETQNYRKLGLSFMCFCFTTWCLQPSAAVTSLHTTPDWASPSTSRDSWSRARTQYSSPSRSVNSGKQSERSAWNGGILRTKHLHRAATGTISFQFYNKVLV